MNKRKTNKSAAKRFKVTGTGKLMRRRSHARHILTKKPRKRVRKLDHPGHGQQGGQGPCEEDAQHLEQQ